MQAHAPALIAEDGEAATQLQIELETLKGKTLTEISVKSDELVKAHGVVRPNSDKATFLGFALC